MKALSALALFGTLLSSAAPALADNDADEARMEALLTQAGYKFNPTSDKTVVWIPFNGKNLGDFRVIAATDKGLEVMFVIVAKKSQIAMTPELASKMLHMNHEFDRVKVGIDDDGDAFVRVDTTVRVLDEVELKAEIDQIAAAADEIYGDMKPYLTS